MREIRTYGGEAGEPRVPVTSWESATPEAGGLTERGQPSRVGLVTGTKS
jgi:hypothetical protein